MSGHAHAWQPAPQRGRAIYECACGAVARKLPNGATRAYTQRYVRQWDRNRGRALAHQAAEDAADRRHEFEDERERRHLSGDDSADATRRALG